MSIGVLLVDDSALMRQTLGGLLQSAPGVELLGAVADPLLAMKRMRQRWPDVIVLDVEMPRMDGITFLRQIMQERPTPIIICSTLTERGTKTTMEALAAGAFTVMAKPQLGLRHFLDTHAREFITHIEAAAQAKSHLLKRSRTEHFPIPPAPAPTPDGAAPDAKPAAAAPFLQPATTTAVTASTSRAAARQTNGAQLVAIGTSTGGTQALETILTALPAHSPALLIVQHMPEAFTAAFAQRLNHLCAIEVREARDGDVVHPGLALIAPGGRHMVLRGREGRYYVEIMDGPLVSRHRPSVNVLFRSVAKHARQHAMGILLTGMGDDGAAGLAEMRDAGADTVAQDEASCVVFGMPREAIRRGAAARVVPLSHMASAIQNCMANTQNSTGVNWIPSKNKD